MYEGKRLRERVWIARVISGLEYLWVTGLALVLLSVFSLLPYKEAIYDMAVYLCMGSVFPLVVLLVCLCEQCTLLKWFTGGLKSFFVLFALYQIQKYWTRVDSLVLFFIFPVLCILITRLYWRSRVDQSNYSKRLVTAFLIFVISLACWVAAQDLVIIKPTFWEWIIDSWRVIPVLIVMAGFSAAALFWQDKDQPKKMWRWMGHSVALLLFAVLCVQSESLHDGRVYAIFGFEHHWAHWIGPIESVRDGGWLLWDVPSQYGFLSILAIACLPIADAWQALYVAQSVLLFFLALAIYAFLSRWGTRLHNYLFALLFTISIVFWFPGPAFEALAGIQPWPDIGPLRYLWFLISIGALWFFLCRKIPHIFRYLWVGSFCWVMGILWSCESGAYCSSVFVSATVVLMLQQAVKTYQTQRSWNKAFRTCLPFAVVPLGMFFLAVTTVWLYYKHYLGNGPDWLAYFEYAIVHVGNKSLLHPYITIHDRIGVVFALLCVFATIVVWKTKAHPGSPQVAAVVGGWFAFFSSLLLYVVVKHPIFIDSGHVFCLLLAIFLPAVDGISRPLLARLVRYALVPVLAFQLTNTYGYSDLLRVAKTIKPPERHLSRTMYPMEPSACLLLDYEGLGNDVPLVCDYLGCMLPPPRHQERNKGPYANTHSWLPKPIVMFSVLPAARQDIYIKRWMKRMPEGGWLLVDRLKYPRKNRVDWIRHPFMPKVIRRLTQLPVNHWTAEFYSAILRHTHWRELTYCSTVHKGELLLTQLNKYYIIQEAVANDNWRLYRCVPRKNGGTG